MFCQSCGKLTYKVAFLAYESKNWCTTPACLQAALQAGVPELAIKAATVFGDENDTGEVKDTEEHDSAISGDSDVTGDVGINDLLGERYE